MATGLPHQTVTRRPRACASTHLPPETNRLRPRRLISNCALDGEVYEPLACPTCRGPMRIIACITQPSVIDQILTHLRPRASAAAPGRARSPPSTRRPSGPGAVRRLAAAHPAHPAHPAH